MDIPGILSDIYPNPIQSINGSPVVVFRDHRWTLPLIVLAAVEGIIRLPVTVIGFDRHPDALEPACGPEPLGAARRQGDCSPEVIVPVVRDLLSPRDDDWVRAGMELGIVGDMIGFGSDSGPGDADTVMIHRDLDGGVHRYVRLGRPHHELSFKGALADMSHPAAADARRILDWQPPRHLQAPSPGSYILDIDLDYWTISWDTYTFPFPPEVMDGEFHAVCQSSGTGPYPVSAFFDALVRGAALVTIATEPDFCGGAAHAGTILDAVNARLFGGGLDVGRMAADYPARYPSV